MNGARLLTLLPTLHTRRPLTVIGAAVIDIIADAWTLPRRGGDIELQQQSVNVGGCALNIAVALKRLGIDASNALPLGQGVWAERIRRRLAKEGLSSVIDAVEGDNGWCLALVEPDAVLLGNAVASWVVGHRGGDCAPTREALLLAHKNV
ncbi:TPA_asm: kinase [Salmonella enterica subsp. enterica serovar Saintpaul]|nr:kinase [Salmonella enterica subsp. enterica serovar Saintpaul]HAE3779050.1 kinase [Salmonella enterica subsp. enterica serovar Saintpaul]